MKERTKSVLVVVLTLCLVFVCSSCGKKETKKEEKTEKAEKTASIDGTMVSFSGKDLTIEADGQDYEFDISEATVNSVNMLAGDEIVVRYEGEIDGTDTTGATAISIEDKGGKATTQEEKTVVGTLVKITENSITIRQNDGTELLFNANNCEHDFKNGIREGNWVAVTYVGEINGTDTKNVKVIKITDDDENTIKKEQKKIKIKEVDENVYCTSNVHVRESYSTDSKILGTLEKGEKIKRTGVCDNGWSRIEYKKQKAYIFGDYLSTKAPDSDSSDDTSLESSTSSSKTDTPKETIDDTSKKQPAQQPQEEEPAPAQQPKEEPKEEYQTATGTVVEVSMNTLTFSVDGKNYTVYIADASHKYKNGIQTGNTVKVTYTGDLSDPDHAVVVSVEDDDANTAAKDAVYKGTVVDATTNTVTIKTSDGVEMTFSKDNAVDNTGGLSQDMKIAVTADASSADSGSNIMPAKQLDPEE